MMNSYEFDQPLDLRLKALNLSLGSYHHGTISGGSCASSSGVSVGGCGGGSISSSASSSNSNISSCSTPSHLTIPSILNSSVLAVAAIPPVPPVYMSGHQAPPARHHQIPQHHHQHHNSILTNSYCHPIDQQHQPQQHAHTNNHLRSATMHCQPLNHHQPHPLSRLHPVPSHLQPNSHVQPQQIHHHQTASLQLHQSSAGGQRNSPPQLLHHQQPVSHRQQQSSPQLPANAKTSTPDHQPSQQGNLYHHQVANSYRQMPVKSLSISCHHHLLPTTSNNSNSNSSSGSGHFSSSSASSPSNASTSSSQSGQVNLTLPGKQLASDIPHQQLMKLSATVGQSDLNALHDMRQQQHANDLNSPTGAPSSNQNQNGTNQTVNSTSCNDSNNNNNNAAAPITRQHSLVSRYQCKPCNISFTQPETLRAHQEGYCTKRDRSQSAQVRSQSAVSPTTLQQSSSTSPTANK